MSRYPDNFDAAACDASQSSGQGNPINPWREGGMCEGDLMQDAAHVWAACMNIKAAEEHLMNMSLYKAGEIVYSGLNKRGYRVELNDEELVAYEAYILSEDIETGQDLCDYLTDTGILDFIRELRPAAAREIERLLP